MPPSSTGGSSGVVPTSCRWELRIVAVGSVGCPAYALWQFEAPQDDATFILQQLVRLPRPAALAFGRTFMWLHPGDCLVLVPSEPE